MATEPIQIDERLLARARRLAEDRHCSIDEVLREALDQLECPKRTASSLIGLFADAPEILDEVMEDVYRTREHVELRQHNHGKGTA
ncbi:MAG: hypothetical protein HY000_23075 [Planctomycetes bacterium]|nr:hypothetical protein [Planctomycetota bacterium]